VSYVRNDSGALSYYIGMPLLFLIALMEASVLPLFRIGGLQPNLMLVLFVAWLTVRGQDEVLFLIPIGGLFLGLADGAPLGTAILALAPVAVLHEVRGAQLGEGQLLFTIIFTVAATFLYHLTYLLVFALQGEAGSLVGAIVRVILPASFLNVVVLLPVYALLWAASRDVRRAAFA